MFGRRGGLHVLAVDAGGSYKDPRNVLCSGGVYGANVPSSSWLRSAEPGGPEAATLPSLPVVTVAFLACSLLPRPSTPAVVSQK